MAHYMKIFGKSICLVIFCLFHLANVLEAKTCAEKLKVHAEWMLAGAIGASIIPYPPVLITVICVLERKAALQGAKKLEAASILANRIIGAQDAEGSAYQEEKARQV